MISPSGANTRKNVHENQIDAAHSKVNNAPLRWPATPDDAIRSARQNVGQRFQPAQPAALPLALPYRVKQNQMVRLTGNPKGRLEALPYAFRPASRPSVN
jgi:hypothetical protein